MNSTTTHTDLYFGVQEKDAFAEELEDVKVMEGEPEATMRCVYSKPTAKIRWFKNKMEIFQGTKYKFVTDDEGEFKIIVHNIRPEDAGRYMCQADEKQTAANLIIEGENSFASFC